MATEEGAEPSKVVYKFKNCKTPLFKFFYLGGGAKKTGGGGGNGGGGGGKQEQTVS